eukprot:gene14872-biopygen21677
MHAHALRPMHTHARSPARARARAHSVSAAPSSPATISHPIAEPILPRRAFFCRSLPPIFPFTRLLQNVIFFWLGVARAWRGHVRFPHSTEERRLASAETRLPVIWRSAAVRRRRPHRHSVPAARRQRAVPTPPPCN